MSEFASTAPSPRPFHSIKKGALLAVLAATLSCSGKDATPPPNTNFSTSREIPEPSCDTVIESPLYEELAPLRNDLNGVNGTDRFLESWKFVQEQVENSLQDKGIPKGSFVEVSTAIGPMITRDEVSEAGIINGNAVGSLEAPAPGGQLADSTLYTFVPDSEPVMTDPDAPLDLLMIKFEPLVTESNCRRI